MHKYMYIHILKKKKNMQNICKNLREVHVWEFHPYVHTAYYKFPQTDSFSLCFCIW